MRCLLPLLVAHTDSRWYEKVMASDASHWGRGVCERVAPVDDVARWGRTAERWRYKQGATAARAHAFHGDADGFSDVLAPDDLPDSLGQADEQARAFDMVDANFTQEVAWHIVESFPWRGPANFLRLEGLALSNPLRHLLRDRGAFGRRVLLLVDNLGLALATGKGRSAAFQLRDILRERERETCPYLSASLAGLRSLGPVRKEPS